MGVDLSFCVVMGIVRFREFSRLKCAFAALTILQKENWERNILPYWLFPENCPPSFNTIIVVTLGCDTCIGCCNNEYLEPPVTTIHTQFDPTVNTDNE